MFLLFRFRQTYITSPSFDANGLFFAFEGDSEEPIGTILAWFGSELPNDTGKLHWLAVAPAHQGRGLGRALCTTALAYIAASGRRRAVLTTESFRTSAIYLYHSLGFEEFVSTS